MFSVKYKKVRNNSMSGVSEKLRTWRIDILKKDLGMTEWSTNSRQAPKNGQEYRYKVDKDENDMLISDPKTGT